MTAPQPQQEDAAEPWRIVIVEDDPIIRQNVIDYLNGEMVAGRPMSLVDVSDFDKAISAIRDRRIDLLILDVFRGSPEANDEAGLRVLDAVRATGFVCTILYTAHPERVEERESHFVRLVGKEAEGLERLREEIDRLFAIHVPQMYRGIVMHLDTVLRDYMWTFVEANWGELSTIAAGPEFLRILLQRLSASLAQHGVEQVTRFVFGADTDHTVAPDRVHPAAMHIMPPLRQDELQLGDIRLRSLAGGAAEHLVVIWPSCDMVNSAGRTPKTDRVICAIARPLAGEQEIVDVTAQPANNKKRSQAERLIGNHRATGNPDRFHAIPGICEVPDLLVDFQHLEVLSLADVVALRGLSTLGSPFAESLFSRFLQYIGRVGAPDVDVAFVLSRLGVPATA